MNFTQGEIFKPSRHHCVNTVAAWHFPITCQPPCFQWVPSRWRETELHCRGYWETAAWHLHLWGPMMATDDKWPTASASDGASARSRCNIHSFCDLGGAVLSSSHSFGKWREDLTVRQRLGRPRQAALWEQTMDGDGVIEKETKVWRRLLIFKHETFPWQLLSRQLKLQRYLLRKVLGMFAPLFAFITIRMNKLTAEQQQTSLSPSVCTWTVCSAFCNKVPWLTETFTLTNAQVYFAKSICVGDKMQP